MDTYHSQRKNINLFKIDENLNKNQFEVVDDIIFNLDRLCFNDKKLVNIIPEVKLGNIKSPDQDFLVPIHSGSFTRLLYGDYLQQPFNQIERVLVYHSHGFLICTLDIDKIKNDSLLSSYDSMKYNLFKNTDQFFLCWIELLCVNPDYRGNNLSENLLNELSMYINHIIQDTNNEYALIGIDIAGTENYWRNLTLKNYYQKLGFEFPESDFHIASGGGQCGLLIVEK